MTTTQRLMTGAWYGDVPLELDFPRGAAVVTCWPATPPPLDDAQLALALEQPVGQPPLRELARGAARPLVVVDDLTRPTPAGRVLPLLLDQFAEAGIPAEAVRILVACGTHGTPPAGALAKKVGAAAAGRCTVLAHDCTRDTVKVGRTRFGTPVLANRAVLASDLVVGVGGIYPQHSAGFGGGAKLALGVLGKRSIVALHYGHASMEGSYEIHNDLRRDLDEIAAMIGLRTSVSLHLDAARQVVRAVSGDHRRYYEDEVAFARQAYRAPLPGDADVVVSNAYPMDVSLTFMRSKGILPLLHAKPGASLVVVAACPEGLGRHGIYPFVNAHRFQRQLHLARAVRARPREIPRKGARLAGRMLGRLRPAAAGAGQRGATVPAPATNRVWLYVPPAERAGERGNAVHGRPAGAGVDPGAPPLPAVIPGMTALRRWPEVLERIRAEQGGREDLKVMVYPCAPLQVLDLAAGAGQPLGAGELSA